MLEKIECVLVGVSPLLMHNQQLADPLNPMTKAIKAVAKKRNKTDADYLELRRLEWMGGLYLDHSGRPAIPSDNVLKCAVEGARVSKLGKNVQAGVFEVEPFYTLEYEGPRDLEELYKTPGFVDYRSVVIAGRRTMRARPRFAVWRLPIALQVAAEIVNPTEVRAALIVAGERYGLGDYRPSRGRFIVE